MDQCTILMQGETVYLFFAEGTIDGETERLIPISNATPMQIWDGTPNRYYIRGSSVPYGSGIEGRRNPPQNRENVAAVNALDSELRRQGWEYRDLPRDQNWDKRWFRRYYRRLGATSGS